MMALTRQLNENLRPNIGASQVSSPSMQELTSATEEIADRSHEITEHRLRKRQTEQAANKRSDQWTKEASIAGRTLVYKNEVKAAQNTNFCKSQGSMPT